MERFEDDDISPGEMEKRPRILEDGMLLGSFNLPTTNITSQSREETTVAMSRRETAEGEPRFEPRSQINTPFWERPATVEEYDDSTGVYDIKGPGGGDYRLVIIDSGYKLLYPHVADWEYNRGSCDFDEIEALSA